MSQFRKHFGKQLAALSTPAIEPIELERLGISVRAQGHSFLDLGIVRDLEGATREICRQRVADTQSVERLLASLSESRGGGLASGRHLGFGNGIGRDWLIFYTADVNPLMTKLIAAHEETHVLHGIGRLDLLEQKLKCDGVELSFTDVASYNQSSLWEREVVAEVGAMVVLFKEGRLKSRADALSHRWLDRKPFNYEQAAIDIWAQAL